MEGRINAKYLDLIKSRSLRNLKAKKYNIYICSIYCLSSKLKLDWAANMQIKIHKIYLCLS